MRPYKPILSIDNNQHNQNHHMNDQNYQNPHKMIKTDENGNGTPVGNLTSGGQKNEEKAPSTVIQIPTPVHPSVIRSQAHGPPQNLQNQGFVKHGTGNDNLHDPQKLASNPSHAPEHDENARYAESKDNDSDDAYSDDPKSRTSASSRVNFSKLTAEEKERRCHNMSKEVKQLRRKIRNMEERLARSNSGQDYRPDEHHSNGVTDSMVQRARDKIKTYQGFELSDQKDLIENLCTVIAQDRMKPDSLAFYMLCTLVRGFLTNEEWTKYEHQPTNNPNSANEEEQLKNKEICVSFPEKEVRISKKEFKVFAPYHENEQIMRLLTGQFVDYGAATTIPNEQPTNEQIELISQMMQGNQNFSNLQGMQNLMNNARSNGMNMNQQTGNNPSSNGMMTSMMGMNNGSQGTSLGMNSNMQSQNNQNQMNSQNAQILNNIMAGQMGSGGNMQWNMAQMAGIGNGYNMDKQSLNDLISSQMMSFNGGNQYMGQDSNTQQNMSGNGQNNPYSQNQGN